MANFKEIDLKEAITALVKNDPGLERGGDFIFLHNYIKAKEGEAALEKITREIKNAGYILPDIRSVNELAWVPSSLVTIFMLASAKVLEWEDGDVMNLGKGAVSMHALVKLFIRYFSSVEKTFVMAAKTWQKHYNFSDISIVDFNKNEKTIRIEIKNFKKHPITCLYLRGLFAKIIEIATGANEVETFETKCEFRGDPCHELIFKWK